MVRCIGRWILPVRPPIDFLMIFALKSALRSLRDLPARRGNARGLRDLTRCTDRHPVVAFGGVLDGKSFIHGGAVKLLHLRDAFASDEKNFNILYLVSSAQPNFADDLVSVCRQRGMRFVWNQNGVGYPAWAGREAERHNAPMRRLRARADAIIYQSAFCRDSAECFLGPVSQPGEILWNPVDLKKFHPPPEPPPSRPLRLLALGTQNYPDRVLSVIEALKTIRSGGVEATLTIAGRLLWPGGEAEVKRTLEQKNLVAHVTLRPAFTQDEAAAYYRSHHILIHPKYLDPCPTVVIEALASGLPVIGSASGGLPEMVPPDCGTLVPVPLDWNRLVTPSGEQLAAAVQTLLPRLPEASRAARHHAETAFDGVRWVDRHRDIFTRLLS